MLHICKAVVSCCWSSTSNGARCKEKSEWKWEWWADRRQVVNSEMRKGKICNFPSNSRAEVWDMWGGIQGQWDKQECKGSSMLESKWQRGEMAEEGSLWWGDCVTEKKVHCGVCNALKTDIMMHCSTHKVISAFLVCSILLPFSSSLFLSLSLSFPLFLSCLCSTSTNDPLVLPHCQPEWCPLTVVLMQKHCCPLPSVLWYIRTHACTHTYIHEHIEV